ncbi:DNA-binding response regulator, LytR/AlgR family [Duganella sacchari]|uniref:DNA-binding response regulator, LytR/AlgR family n=1 Tax=Duganella sacchari TaxID=551987 RepID=A0A1M7MI41_9BURK|nr:LytTR family DNA-binding domain-containing protein [Duganella sacchari]SHM90540.1 DNA-binding response regulator, LytR/AlgR family [Duganella sacchari]
MYTALIADDEPVLVDFLQAELAALWPELTVVAAASNGVDALRLIGELAPSVVFLDIRMPGLTGLEVAQRLQAFNAVPHVVFVTAHDQYAVDAFEREAVDYLLKPPTRERLRRAVDRLKRQLAATDRARPTAALLARLEAALAPPVATRSLAWILAAHGNETRLIALDEVIYFEANDKYVSVFTEEGESLIRTPLAELIAGLDASLFWQVHRSTVVAVRHVAGTRRDFRGRMLVKLKKRPEELPVSRAYLHLFRQIEF